MEAGLDLVDRDGVGALTMRRLGRELGVEAMSLYTHVENKQDLLDGVLSRVYGEIPSPNGSSNGPWQERLRSMARYFRQALLDHPNVVELAAARPVLTEGSFGLVDSALGGLRAWGLDLVRASYVVSIVVAFTVGHVASEVGDLVSDESDGNGERPRPSVDALRFPHLAERTELGAVDRDASFSLGIDFIVAGVEPLVQRN